MKTEKSLQSGSGVESGPATQTYHDKTTVARCLAVASAGKKLRAGLQRVPNFFPAEWPIGAIIIYISLLAAGVYSGQILWSLALLSGNSLLAFATPALIACVEFVLVPGIKYGSLRDKQVASMRAFVAEDRAARDAAAHAAAAWGWRDFAVLLILLLCFGAKALVLLHFGTFQAPMLLAANWLIAFFDFSFHISGLTTRVPCYVGSRILDWLHLRRRRAQGYKVMGERGIPVLGSLPFREFPFTTDVNVRAGEVNGNLLTHADSDQAGHHYVLYSPATLDDADRAAFLNCQPNHLAQTELARALARVQLEQLTLPEMRALKFSPTPIVPSPIIVSDPGLLVSSAEIVVEKSPTIQPDHHHAALGGKLIAIIGAVAALGLSSCGDRSATITARDKSVEAKIIITQPAAADAIPRLFETLQEAFVHIAEVSRGAHVPDPHIEILLEDGKLVPVQPPPSKGGLFGSGTPKARQARLEGLLKTMKNNLTAGCGGHPISFSAIKDTHAKNFKQGTCTVWAAGGGVSPWTDGELGPAVFIEEREAFADALTNWKGNAGNFFIISDTTSTVVSPDRRNDPTSPQTDTRESNPTGKGEPAAVGSSDIAQRKSDTIVVDVKNYPLAGRAGDATNYATAARPELSTISLPQGVEPVGDPIGFGPNSAKLTSAGQAAVKRAAKLLRSRSPEDQFTLFLVASADYRSDENYNERLSQRRAEAVQVALLQEKISIDRIIAVGESLSPEGTTGDALAAQRIVRLWVLPQSKKVSVVP